MTAPPHDTDFGTFSDDPPWIVDPDDLPWSEGIDEVRANVRRSVPELVRSRKLPPIGRLLVTARHLGGAILMWRLVGRRRARKSGDPSASRADLALRIRRACERLGPTYIKLAQIISAGEGVFPQELVD